MEAIILKADKQRGITSSSAKGRHQEEATARAEAKLTTHVVCLAHILIGQKPYTGLELCIATGTCAMASRERGYI